MKTRYNKTIAGRVTPVVRKSIQAQVKSFIQANQHYSFNLVFGAVIYHAERLPGRLNEERVSALLNEQTIKLYQMELDRRSQARKQQIIGIVRRLLPVSLRKNDQLVAHIAREAEKSGASSIPAITQAIKPFAEAAAENEDSLQASE
jgi:hypothetical protein